MIIWLVFYIVVLSLAIGYQSERNNEYAGKVLLTIIMLVFVYFTAFRDGLGQDYSGYVDTTSRYVHIVENNWLLTEPLVNELKIFCYNTAFSSVFFFLVMASITLIPIIFVYSRSKYFAVILLIYMAVPGFFMSAFNIIRQAAVAGIFLLVVYLYIEKFTQTSNHIKLLFAVITIGLCFFIHKTALILIPFLFIGHERINVKLIISLLIFSFFSGIIISHIGLLQNLMLILNYSDYLNYDTTTSSLLSFTNILVILLILLSLHQVKRRCITNSWYIYCIKMATFSVFFNNVSATGFPIAYRIASYFGLFVPILFGLFIQYCIPKNREVLKGLVISTFMLFSIYFMFNNKDNKLIVPDRILPFEAIYDKGFQSRVF